MAFVTTVMPMSALMGFVNDIHDAYTRGTALAVIDATEMAYKDAVENAKAQFNRTPGRTRTGQLMNAIYRGYDKDAGQGFVGVNLPYGAIQEFGGVVTPQSAKHLWVKNYVGVDGQFKRWTPSDFMAAHNQSPGQYPIYTSPHTGKLIAAYKARGASPGQMQALFTLVSRVTIPETPYVRPAVQAAYEKLAGLIQKRVAQELEK